MFLLNYFSHWGYFISMWEGLNIINARGMRWRAIRVCSEVVIGRAFVIKLGKEFLLVLTSIRREYKAPNIVAVVIMGVDKIFQSIMVDIMRSSPIRLGVGGSPRFVTHVIIHHTVSSGVTSLKPRVIERVRVVFRS